MVECPMLAYLYMVLVKYSDFIAIIDIKQISTKWENGRLAVQILWLKQDGLLTPCRKVWGGRKHLLGFV